MCLAIVITALSVTVCWIATFKLPKCSRIDLWHSNVGQGDKLQRRRICDWMDFWLQGVEGGGFA